jgi:(p)ppGpp synthase/HD superfamily hydrolase
VLYTLPSDVFVNDVLRSEESLVIRADIFAVAAHGAIGHKRKYTGVPYHDHLRRVALYVSLHCKDPEVLAAALLHDVLEDTSVDAVTLATHFGPNVSKMVLDLSDTPATEGGPNRAARKEIDRNRLANAGNWVGLIKLADLIDNSSSIVEHDPSFAKVYLREKEALLKVLPTEMGLYDWASSVLKSAKSKVYVL